MADQDSDGTLSMLRQTLDQWGRSVPAEATRFHERRAGLLARVTDEQGRWRLFGRDEAVAALARETRSLSSVAEGLTGAIERVKGIRGGVEHARGMVGRLNDSALTQWFEQWRVNWHFRMNGVGRSTEREQDLSLDIQVMQAVEWEVTEIRTSVQVFAEAHGLLVQFGGHLKAPLLRADLTALREKLLRSGPSVEWHDDAARAMAPFHAIANEPAPEPPADLAAAYRRATEAETWSDAIGVDVAAAEELVRSVVEAQRDPAQWTERAVAALVAQTKDLAARLRDEAHRRRAAAEESLRADLQAVQEACGVLPDLADEICRVERFSRDEPYGHEQWREAFPGAHRRLLQEIGARRRDVAGWVRARRGNLLARLADLAPGPLAASESQARSVLVAEIESAEALPEAAEHVLDRLHAMLRWVAATDRLEGSARAAAETIERRRGAVSTRHAEMARYEDALGLPAEDWDTALARLCAPSGPVEPLLESLLLLERQIERRSLAVVQKCREKMTEDVELCRRATALVQTILSGVTAAPPPVWAPEITAAGAVSVRESAQRAREHALALVAQATTGLLARLPEVRAHMEDAMTRPDTAEENRISAQEILDVLAAEGWKSLAPLEGLERLKGLLRRADVVLDELSARENELTRLRAELDGMFSNASEEGLGKYLPDRLAQRARLLRRGLPDRPRYLGAAIHQLEGARTLFSRSMEHARRLAVSRFSTALTRVDAEAARDSKFSACAEPVLLEVRSLPRDQLPPADVRERVIQLAVSVRTGGHHG